MKYFIWILLWSHQAGFLSVLLSHFLGVRYLFFKLHWIQCRIILFSKFLLFVNKWETKKAWRNLGLKRFKTLDLCNANAVLYQLSYEASWELQLNGYNVNLQNDQKYMKYICIWTAAERMNKWETIAFCLVSFVHSFINSSNYTQLCKFKINMSQTPIHKRNGAKG